VSDQPSKTGLYVSGALHSALLAFIVFGFAWAPKFEDAPESIPIDTITQSQFNEIMKGERNAKPAKEAPAAPTTPQAAVEPPAVPTPPPPPPELNKADELTPVPPPKPAPPTPKAVADDAPTPPVKPKEPPPEKFKPDAVAKFLEKSRPDEPAKPQKAYDPNAIAKLIDQSKPSADPAPPGAATPQGLPDQHAARMSPSLSAALDAWLQDAYFSCWTPPPTMPEGERYVAEVRVDFNADGTLASAPALLNPPSDPAWRAHAESAMRAVLKCNPLHVPPEYAPYYEQWRTKTVHFDPQSALG